MNNRKIMMGSNPVVPFPSVFVSAIVFAGVLRLLDVFILLSTTPDGFTDLWLGRRMLPFSIGDIVLACGALFLLLSLFGVVRNPRSLAAWMTLGFCLLLMCYTAGLRFFPEAL